MNGVPVPPFRLASTANSSPATIDWNLEIDSDGDAVLIGNGVKVLFVSRKSCNVRRWSLLDESKEKLPGILFDDTDRIMVESYVY